MAVLWLIRMVCSLFNMCDLCPTRVASLLSLLSIPCPLSFCPANQNGFFCSSAGMSPFMSMTYADLIEWKASHYLLQASILLFDVSSASIMALYQSFASLPFLNCCLIFWSGSTLSLSHRHCLTPLHSLYSLSTMRTPPDQEHTSDPTLEFNFMLIAKGLKNNVSFPNPSAEIVHLSPFGQHIPRIVNRRIRQCLPHVHTVMSLFLY